MYLYIIHIRISVPSTRRIRNPEDEKEEVEEDAKRTKRREGKGDRSCRVARGTN